MVLHPSNEGEPIWTVFSGVIPDGADVAPVYCFRHGGGQVRGEAITEKVSAFRRTGKKRRIAVQVSRS
jgi:hypothetical protein